MATENTQTAAPPRRGEEREFLIEVRGVAKSFGRRQVMHDITFSVRRGTTMSIMGGSGVGKSTLLKILIGALKPDEGEVRIDGVDLATLDERGLDAVRRRFAVLFQSGALLNSLTVAENIALPMRFHGNLIESEMQEHVRIKLAQAFPLPEEADEQKARQWADHLKMLLARLPGTLSGGERKRVALARALALDPRILFYDEPTSGLDPMTTAEVGLLINRMRDKMRLTSLVITHDVKSAFQISDRIILLDEGTILEQGTPDEIRASTHPRVRDFIEGRVEARPERRNLNERFWRDLLEL
jgi:phospholipid/cholesterol/gamma-HCH transport system ATP-binding protein